MNRFNRKYVRIVSVILVVFLSQQACRFGVPLPTNTPQPTQTQLPSDTPEPEATWTPSPTVAEMTTPTQAVIEIGIAVMGPMSGQLSDFGQSEQNGVLLAIEQWNEKSIARVSNSVQL